MAQLSGSLTAGHPGAAHARKWATLSFLVTVWYYFSYEYNTHLKAWLSVTQPAAAPSHATAAAALSGSSAGQTATGGGALPTTAASSAAAEAEYQRQHQLAVEASWLSPVTLPLLLAIFTTTTAATIPWVLHAASASPQLFAAWRRLWTHHTLDMTLMCASTVFGTAAITVVYEYGSIQLVQVARSIGPLFTTGWAVLLLNQLTHGKPLLCLLATLGGTLLASWKEPTMCAMTLVLMVSANTCMTFRNVITRRLLSVLGIGHGHGHGHGAAQQQHAAAAPPGGKQQQQHNGKDGGGGDAKAEASPLLQLGAAPPQQQEGEEGGYGDVAPTHMASLLLTTGNATGVVVLVATVLLASWLDPKAASLVSDIDASAARHLLVLGGTNWAYNLASQLVLAQLPVVAHGMLELLKRVFVLVAVSVFAQKAHWHWHNVLGACVTFVAAALYFHYSHEQKHRQQHAHAQHGPATPRPKGAAPDSPPGGGYAAAGSQLRLASVSGVVHLLQSLVGGGGGGATTAAAQQQRHARQGHHGDHVAELDQDSKVQRLDGAQPASDEDEGDVLVVLPSPRKRGGAPDAAAVVHVKGGGGGEAPAHAADSGSDHLHHRAARHGADAVGGGAHPHAARHARSSSGGSAAGVACLPAAGPPRLNVARCLVVGVMLLTIPLLVPLGSWPYILGSEPRPTVLAGYREYHLPSGSTSSSAAAAAAVQPGGAPLAAAAADGGAPQTLVRRLQRWAGRRLLGPQVDGAARRLWEATPEEGWNQVDPKNTKHLFGYYVGWLGHNNLGDEIVADIFYDLLTQMVAERTPQGATVEFVKQYDRELPRRYRGCGARGYWRCHFAVMGGGSTIDAFFLALAKDMFLRKRPVLLWGCGYQRVHRDAKVQASTLDMLMNGTLVGGIRGHITEEFLMQRTNKTLPVIGDSGFLAGAMYPGAGLSMPDAPNLPAKLAAGEPVPRWPPAAECIEAARAEGRLREQEAGTGVMRIPQGAGGSADEATGGKCERPLAVVTLRSELTNYDLSKDGAALKDEQDIEQMRVPRHPIAIMMLVIADLVNEHHFQVVLQDVDDKSLAVHERYMAMINKRIQPGNPPVVLHKKHDKYPEVMDLYERAAVSINCRLHSGVLAASALRPIVYMASLPKFIDFMTSIEQENFLVNPESPELKGAHTVDIAKLLVSKVLQAVRDAGPISAALQRTRDATMAKYRQATRDMLDRLALDNPDAFRDTISNCMSVRIKRSHCVAERTTISLECVA